MDEILSGLWAILQPHLAECLALIIAAVMAQGVSALRRWTGVQISQRHADRLSAAITRAAVLAIDRDLTGEHARELVLEYLRETVPDALRAVGASDLALRLRADATLAEVRAGSLR